MWEADLEEHRILQDFPATQTSSVHCGKIKHVEQLELIISKQKDWG